MRTYIKRLVIAGFKSFGKRSSIPFYPGFTAIVGENGTGKSNILDAITFVMGYRSRALRAGKLEHLLHTGPKGETVPEAEVSLVLDNSSGTFDELLPEHVDEVVISRRITPSSSTYRILGKVVPAGQVEKLLSLGGIEPEGHYIVEQGTVTEVLERSPKRRRELIEEVAGIAAYEERKAKAIKELAQVKERLNASRILLAERRRHLVALHREREAALEYRELSAERDRILATLKFLRFRELKEAEARLKEELRRHRKEAERLSAEVEELDRRVEELEWKLKAQKEASQEEGGEEEVLKLVQRVERLRGELAAKEAEARAKEREIRSLTDALEEIKRLSPPARRVPEAVQEVLALGWEGVIGTLGDLGEVPPELRVALEAALGGHAHDIVVRNRDVALKCVRYLKENEIGRARFLPLDKLSPPPISPKARELCKRAGVLGLLVEMVRCDTEIIPAFQYVLADTLVVESLEVLRDVLGIRAVSLDGDVLERGGAIVGGFRKRRRHVPDLDSRKAQIERLREELSRLQGEIARLKREAAEAEEELHRASLRHAQKKRTRSEVEEQLAGLRERRKEVYRALERARGLLARYERELGEVQGKLALIGEAPEPEEMAPGSLNALQARLRDLETRLSSFGPVNMRAIEEYEAFLAEFQAFKERVKTLEREKRELETLIADIERKKRERFLATMEAVSAELNRRFVQLFGGGEAGLSLEDPEDLSSGLLVRARPPGKEPKLLDSLSGGEKTLVAIAFVLALSAGKPAPFYFFDEVDAALDRPNSERLARLLREIAHEAQVIVISHNEELIQHADRVYGVTMRGGSSRVLAVELVGHAR